MFADVEKARQSLNELAQHLREKEKMEAHVLARMSAAHYALLCHDITATRNAMDECGKQLETFARVDPIIHAGYYRVCMEYHKVCGCEGGRGMCVACHAAMCVCV